MTNSHTDKLWYRFLSNKYIWVVLFFSTWMLFLDNYSYFEHRVLDRQIDELEDNKKYYKEEIKKDQEKIKSLQNINQIEKYAREKYYMKKENEDVYIIEFEGDSAKSKPSD